MYGNQGVNAGNGLLALAGSPEPAQIGQQRGPWGGMNPNAGPSQNGWMGQYLAAGGDRPGSPEFRADRQAGEHPFIDWLRQQPNWPGQGFGNDQSGQDGMGAFQYRNPQRFANQMPAPAFNAQPSSGGAGGPGGSGYGNYGGNISDWFQQR